MAETVADFFTNIVKDFTPLKVEDFPEHTSVSKNEPVLQVTEEQVEKRLRVCKKPRGLLSGDIFPDLLVKYATQLSAVVTNVLNAAYAQESWPPIWKVESVSTIPKTSHPEASMR